MTLKSFPVTVVIVKISDEYHDLLLAFAVLYQSGQGGNLRLFIIVSILKLV